MQVVTRAFMAKVFRADLKSQNVFLEVLVYLFFPSSSGTHCCCVYAHIIAAQDGNVMFGSLTSLLFFSKITFLSHTNTTRTLHLTRLQQALSTMQIVLKRARRSGFTGYEPMGTFSPVLQSCTSTRNVLSH